MMRCASLVLVAAVAACVAQPEDRVDTSFDSSGGVIEVVVLGDGFVRTGGRRIPLERFVLELRWAMRAMSQDQRDRYLVRLRVADSLRDSMALAAQENLNRLLLELDVMEIGQVKVQ